jgi:hypothetical protein
VTRIEIAPASVFVDQHPVNDEELATRNRPRIRDRIRYLDVHPRFLNWREPGHDCLHSERLESVQCRGIRAVLGRSTIELRDGMNPDLLRLRLQIPSDALASVLLHIHHEAFGRLGTTLAIKS